LLAGVGLELREARLAAGLSQTVVGSLLGSAHNKVSRVEAGSLLTASILDIAKHAAVLGLELSVKLYPDGPPIRDAAHVALLERLKAKLGSDLRLKTEVPLPIDGDRRAWDAVIYGAGEPIGVEAETRVRDTQALMRRIALKRRDAGIECVLLVVSASRGNRQLVREMDAVLAASFPVSSRVVLAALGAGRRPPGSGVLVL
jgi:transcriptional regulator with XRE-family HTH domain